MIGQLTLRSCRLVGAVWLALALSGCAGDYAPDPSTYVTVPVKAGDTAAGVAARYKVEQDDVLAMNGLSDPKKRLPGNSVRVPTYGKAQADPPAETLERPVVPVRSHYTRAPLPPVKAAQATETAASVPVPKPRPISKAPLAAPQPAQASPWFDAQWFSSFVSDVPAAKPGSVTFAWPLQGRVIANFGANGEGERNDGINIAASRGAPIHASADGTVTYVGDEIKAYGNLILIRHDNGYVTAYAHADSVTVERGERVTRGQVIAHAGATGDVDRPQLHFELRAGTKPVDPKPYLVAAK